MKKLFIFSIISLTALFISCDDKIDIDLPDSDAVIVVDAWLNNLPENQKIILTWSQNYFDSNEPTGITDAQVTVTDGADTFDFVHTDNGTYIWTPPDGEVFGTIGSEYTLAVNINGEEFTSVTQMNQVPTVDSVTFKFEPEDTFFPDSYLGEFWSRDIEGEGNTYWIKSYKNGELLSKPSEMNIAYDAGFNKGGGLDNLIFIPPIRNAVNPFDEDANDEFVSPYKDGDALKVEIHSISEDAFNFLTNVRVQTDRPGGFGELFAQPLSNVPTNIVSSNPNATKVAQGFFNVAAIESNSATLDVSKVPKGN
ncbi:DUF4249 domain-containing protein [Reichenbachiella sp. MALMAid0571]|uniref:DUF4249 domain-containing protein n=1 Tax=Reichenbachiella sp. MALMAid0571 TaxID=3143939 RepID=UPI0032E03227